VANEIEIVVKATATGLKGEIKKAVDAASAGVSIDVPVTPDTATLKTEVRSAVTEAGTDQEINVSVKADSGGLRGEVTAAVTAAGAGQNIDVPVRIDENLARNAGERAGAAAAQGVISQFQNLNLGSFLASAVSAAVIPAMQSIGQLSGALGLIPAAATGAATAIGTVALGVQGMGDAFTATEKATKAQEAALKADQAAATAHTAAVQANTTAGTANVAALKQSAAATQDAARAASQARTAHEAAAKAADEQAAAMNNLAPAAREVVSQIIQLKPAFDSARMEVQQALFVGLGAEIKKLSESVLPVARGGLIQMADALNGVVKEITGFMQQKSSIESWKNIFTDLAKTVENFSGAIKPILQIFTDLTEVGASMLPGLAQGFANAIQKAADFVSKAKETGQLREWIQTGIDAVKTLWGIFSDLVKIIAEVTKAPGPGLLDMIKSILDTVLALIREFPVLIPLVEAFFAAWLIAKTVQGITDMVKTVSKLVSGLKEADRAAKALQTALLAVGAAYLIGKGLQAVGKDTPQNTADIATASPNDKLKSGAGTAGKLFTGDLKGALDDIKRQFAAVPLEWQLAVTKLKLIWTSIWADIKQITSSGVSTVVDFFKGIGSKIKTAMGDAKQWIGQKAQDMWDGFREKLNTGWTTVTTFFKSISGKVATAIGDAKQWLAQKAQDMWNGFKEKLSSAWTTVSTWIADTSNKIKTAIGDLKDTLAQKAQNLWDGFKAKLESAWTTVVDWLKDISNKIGAAVGDLWSSLAKAGQAAISGFYQAMVDFYNNTIVPWLQSIAQSIASLKGPASKDYYILHDAGTQIMAGLHDSMQKRWGPIVSWLRGLGGLISGHFGHTAGPGGGGGVPAEVPLAALTGAITSATQTVGFTGGLASLASATHRTVRGVTYGDVPLTSQPAPGSGSTGGGGRGHGRHGNVAHIGSDSALGRLLLELLRGQMRALGGDVQIILGAR
jgi:phage-related protein